MNNKVVESWRRPLAPRGHRATLATVSLGLLPMIAALLIPDGVLQARVAMSGLGLVLLGVGFLRPRFAWKYDEGWRWILGDRAYAAMFILFGILIVLFAWLSPIST